MKILTVGDKKEERFLRTQAKPFNFSSTNRKEVNELLTRMKRIMHDANGIGLSANQIGLPHRLFVAHVPDRHGNYKFYAIFNPRIEKVGGEKSDLEEGCLSVPGLYAEMERHEQVVLRGLDKSGKPLKIKAWGLLAQVFQHETDHLDGKLIVDKAKRLYETPRAERLKEREKELREGR